MIRRKVIPLKARPRLTPLAPIPPAELFEGLFYNGGEEYLALYFEHGKLFYEDAATWYIANHEAFLVWANHPAWREAVDKSGVLQGRNWLLLDRVNRRSFAGQRELIIPILCAQQPLPCSTTLKRSWASVRDDVLADLEAWLNERMES